ncbi:MAG: TIGR03546 family protein [Deferribacteres bacterium]|nr:TIGR03546 family protein [candidate division KSB1 bacterium]MCB9511683.1 TIGR03546 family protein [Deferribacteres bacterium]
MFWLSFISDFFRALRSGQEPGQVSAGFSIGYLIGLMPFFSLQTVLLFALLFLLNVNLAAGFVAIFIAGFVAWLLDPLIHSLGFWVLVEIPALHGLWESLYNLPIAPLTRFYNTVSMGSILIGIITVWPVFWGMKKLVINYRDRIEARIKKWKIVQAVKSSKLYGWYEKILRIRELT